MTYRGPLKPQDEAPNKPPDPWDLVADGEWIPTTHQACK